MMRQAGAPAPVVLTERLLLRGPSTADYENILDLWSDPAVTRYIGGRPSTPVECWARLLGMAGHWSLLGFGFWLVEERETGRFVGQAGMARLHRELGPDFDEAPEVGWVLAPWCHGRGYATEAVQAALAWAEREIALTRAVCMIDPDHRASLNVAGKCGFRRFAEAEFRESPVVLLERAS
jgi:RimJ/RimL family protein N-acetyltransferase